VSGWEPRNWEISATIWAVLLNTLTWLLSGNNCHATLHLQHSARFSVVVWRLIFSRLFEMPVNWLKCCYYWTHLIPLSYTLSISSLSVLLAPAAASNVIAASIRSSDQSHKNFRHHVTVCTSVVIVVVWPWCLKNYKKSYTTVWQCTLLQPVVVNKTSSGTEFKVVVIIVSHHCYLLYLPYTIL